MKKIEDPFIIEKYYNELNMQEIFINDVTKHMKLLKFDKYEYLSSWFSGKKNQYFLEMCDIKSNW